MGRPEDLQMREWWGSRLDWEKRLCVAIVAVILTAITVMSVLWWRDKQAEKDLVHKGISYLENLEKRDVSTIKNSIKATKSELNSDLADSDESAIWGGFENAVICGDSRALGFSFYEFVPEERVLAKGGGKITDVTEEIDLLKQLNPEQIFLCFGLNDIGIGFWPEPADYCAEYEKLLQLLAKELPDSTVYINSILPAVGVGLDADPNYVRIGDYNAALQSMCEEKGYHYVDNTFFAEEHSDMYQEDGLHIMKELYKYWAANMLAEVE